MRMRNGTTENPNGVISVPLIVSAPFGWSQPHDEDWRMASTMRKKPEADRAAPTTSRPGGFSGTGLCFIRFRMRRMTATITTSPTNT